MSNRQARAATKTFIKQKLGLELSETEKRMVDKAAIQAELSAAFDAANVNAQNPAAFT